MAPNAYLLAGLWFLKSVLRLFIISVAMAGNEEEKGDISLEMSYQKGREATLVVFKI